MDLYGITQQVYKDGTWHFRHDPPGGSTERPKRRRRERSRSPARARKGSRSRSRRKYARNGRLC